MPVGLDINTQGFAGAHFATFPPKLVEPCIKASTRPRDYVLDPFFGSGTVGLVAQELGRRYVGIELHPQYVALAAGRLTAGTQKIVIFCGLMIRVSDPELQVTFATILAQIRNLYLQDALSETVRGLDITEIDPQLAAHVPVKSLAALAGHGLRGEMMFRLPMVLTANPRLLGYYRLLYGYSQKEFYAAATGISRFRGMEERGTVAKKNQRIFPSYAMPYAAPVSCSLRGSGWRKSAQPC